MSIWSSLQPDHLKKYGSPDGHNFESFFFHVAVENNKHCEAFGKIGKIEDIDTLLGELESLGWWIIVTENESGSKRNYTLVCENGAIDLNYIKDKTCSVRFAALDDDLYIKTRDILNTHLIKNPIDDGSIYSICNTPNGLDTTAIGKAAIEYVEDNYSPSVIEDIRFVIEDLKSDNPVGRLTIIEGPAGTGKTSLARMIIGQTPNSKHFIVPPNLVGDLGSPAIVPLLVRLNEEKEGNSHPTIFLLEDADDCLLPRGGDNMSLISAMLNLTDGILGRMIDIRIVVTSNAKKVQMDEALLRPGRLSKHIHLAELSKEHAEAVHRRLAGTFKSFSGPKTLAEIYATVAGYRDTSTKEKAIGF